MNSEELTSMLAHMHLDATVIAADQLIFKNDTLYIVNNQPSHMYGQHWVSMYLYDNDKCLFFDSFGKDLLYYKHFRQFVHDHISMYQYCPVALQKTQTNSCGKYCLYFSFLLSKGFSFKDIISNFTSNLAQNEIMVNHFLLLYTK